MPNIVSFSAKVMRSFDYCHFEISLSATVNPSIEDETPIEIYVDELRKKAARLADKAVAQYKIAKRNFETVEYDEDTRKRMDEYAREIREIAEPDRTETQKARLKEYEDRMHAKRPRRFDYEDDWQDDEEF